MAALAMSVGGARADVAVEQRDVVKRYERLEAAALRVADALAESEPDRAEQLRRAIADARREGLVDRFDRVVGLLERRRLAAARGDQNRLAEQLESLLRDVMADPGQARLEEERARIERLRKRLRRAVRKQRDLRRRAERAADRDAQQAEQERLADEVAEAREEGAGKRADESGDASGRQAGPPSDPAPSDPAPSDQDPSDQPTPNADADAIDGPLGEAESAMREAAERLVDPDGGADEPQRRAQRRLEDALRRVEERLRQLREEEQQQRLARLAERFERMRRDQQAVIDRTEPLVAAPAGEGEEPERRAQADRATRLAAARVAELESAVAESAERAQRLVRGEDASLAFDEALGQLVGDLRAAESRLRAVRLDALLLALERSALAAIDELAAAVEESRNELERRQADREASGGSGGQSAPLVSRIAELRLLRSTQAGLLRRTRLYAEALKGDGIESEERERDAGELAERLEQLAAAQRRLAEATTRAARSMAPPGP